MDQMEDVLIDCDNDDDDGVVVVEERPTTSGTSRKPTTTTPYQHTTTATIETLENGATWQAQFSDFNRAGVHAASRESAKRDSVVESAIMMYSPDIPSAEGKQEFGARSNYLANYYVAIETEESVKCIVSTTLFVAIVVAIFLVAILQNPQM